MIWILPDNFKALAKHIHTFLSTWQKLATTHTHTFLVPSSYIYVCNTPPDIETKARIAVCTSLWPAIFTLNRTTAMTLSVENFCKLFLTCLKFLWHFAQFGVVFVFIFLVIKFNCILQRHSIAIKYCNNWQRQIKDWSLIRRQLMSVRLLMKSVWMAWRRTDCTKDCVMPLLLLLFYLYALLLCYEINENTKPFAETRI